MVKNFAKSFSKIWCHSRGWLSFSCPHGVVYYLKFLLGSESSRDYVDGLLSMEHLPNIAVIDMAHIVANHALVSRKENMIKYGYDENGILFKPYNGRVADPENPENVANAIENRLEVSFPWICQHHQSKISTNDARQECHQVHPVTGTDIRLCLFDRFHEGNTSSEIESLRKIGCVLELNRMFNSEVEEQLHLKFDSNKKFLNIMTPINHIYLIRSIIDYHSSNKNSNFMKSLQQKTHFLVTFDTLGRLQFETSLKANNNSVGLPLSTIAQDGNKETEVQTEGFSLEKRCQVSLHPSTIKKLNCQKMKVTVKLQTNSSVTMMTRVN